MPTRIARGTGGLVSIEACLLGVAVSAKPIEAAGSRQPIVNVGFALEPFDPHGLDAWALGDDLPIALGNAFHLECHSGGFGHAALWTSRAIGANWLRDRERMVMSSHPHEQRRPV